MSFAEGGSLAMFPLAWIKKCIATYTKDHGKAPKILVVNDDDFIDYKLNSSLHQASQLGVKVTHGSYLKKGEIDLAMGIKGVDIENES
jgi:hypothetical protein